MKLEKYRKSPEQKTHQMPEPISRCRECRDVGLVALPGQTLESFGDSEIFSKAIPCQCEAGTVFRIDFAIRGELCDAPCCEQEARHGADWGGARHGADWGGVVKWCDTHQLIAVDAWRRAVHAAESRGVPLAVDGWKRTVRRVVAK